MPDPPVVFRVLGHENGRAGFEAVADHGSGSILPDRVAQVGVGEHLGARRLGDVLLVSGQLLLRELQKLRPLIGTIAQRGRVEDLDVFGYRVDERGGEFGVPSFDAGTLRLRRAQHLRHLIDAEVLPDVPHLDRDMPKRRGLDVAAIPLNALLLIVPAEGMKLVDGLLVPRPTKHGPVDAHQAGGILADRRGHLRLLRVPEGRSGIVGLPPVGPVAAIFLAGEQRIGGRAVPVLRRLDHLVESDGPVRLSRVRLEDGNVQGVAEAPVVDRRVRAFGRSFARAVPSQHDWRLRVGRHGHIDHDGRHQVLRDRLALALRDDVRLVGEGYFDHHGRGPSCTAGSASRTGLILNASVSRSISSRSLGPRYTMRSASRAGSVSA